MTETRLHELQIILYETGDKKLRELASKLGDPKYQTNPNKLKLQEELLNLLGKLIDPHSFFLLKQARRSIHKITNRLIFDGGWFPSKKGITDLTTEERAIQNFPDEYEEGKRLYHLDRDEKGFHVADDEPKPFSIYDFARRTEKAFLEKRRKELEVLHEAYCVEEKIMGGNYIVEPMNSDLVELICEYFGYEKQIEKVPTK